MLHTAALACVRDPLITCMDSSACSEPEATERKAG